MSCLLGLEVFQPWCIPGFILLVCGTLMYNEIVVVPCGGYNTNTKVAIAEREGRSGDGKDAAYLSSSPAAVYDSKRFQRGLANKMN